MDADTPDPPGRHRGPDPDGAPARMIAHPTDAQREAGRVVRDFSVFSPRVLDACRRAKPLEEGEYEFADAVNVLINRRTLGWR